jgi:uncharacterized membrane protein
MQEMETIFWKIRLAIVLLAACVAASASWTENVAQDHIATRSSAAERLRNRFELGERIGIVVMGPSSKQGGSAKQPSSPIPSPTNPNSTGTTTGSTTTTGNTTSAAGGTDAGDYNRNPRGICVPKVRVNVPVLNVDRLVLTADRVQASFAVRAKVEPIFWLSVGGIADMEKVNLTLTRVRGSAFLEADDTDVCYMVERALATKERLAL